MKFKNIIISICKTSYELVKNLKFILCSYKYIEITVYQIEIYYRNIQRQMQLSPNVVENFQKYSRII